MGKTKQKKNQAKKTPTQQNKTNKHIRNAGPVRKIAWIRDGLNTDPHNNDRTLVHITWCGFTTA